MTYADLLADPDLIARHLLNDNSASNVVAASVGSNGALHGSTWATSGGNTSAIATTGPFGGALNLNGSSQAIGIPCSIATAGAACFRLRLDSAPGAEVFAFSHRNGSTNSRTYVAVNTNRTLTLTHGSGGTATTAAALTVGQWYSIVVTWSGSNCNLYLDGSLSATVNSAYAGGWLGRYTLGAFSQSSSSVASFADATFSDSLTFDRQLTIDEAAAYHAGPGYAPENLSPPTLTIDSTSFTGSVGSWDAMGAGPLSYAWELRDGTDAVIDSGTGAAISGSGSFSGSYYLWVRATNSVGSESAASSPVEAGEPEPIQAELPDVEVPLEVESATPTTEFDATPASIAAAIQVEIATPTTSFTATLHDIVISTEVESVTASAGQLATLGIVSQSIEAEAMAATTAYTATLHDIEIPLAVEHAEPSFTEIPQTSLSDSTLAVEVEQMAPAVSYIASLYDISLPLEVFSGEATPPVTGNVFGLKTASGYFFLRV